VTLFVSTENPYLRIFFFKRKIFKKCFFKNIFYCSIVPLFHGPHPDRSYLRKFLKNIFFSNIFFSKNFFFQKKTSAVTLSELQLKTLSRGVCVSWYLKRSVLALSELLIVLAFGTWLIRPQEKLKK